ncbi:MAG: hypothetical protein A2231_07925 [Candidatus Firestonebacteria bacterium RIFOXYA2_FULL_40_8]|nr:MAG: hypothetical protein A2231_07925 [Candidatus Firestonebacteria bacterium RIFOXYA2_FULL_40_8]
MKKNVLVLAAVLIAGLSGMVFAEEQPKNTDKIIIKYGLDNNGLQNYPATLSVPAFPIVGAQSLGVDLGASYLLEIQHPVSDKLSLGIGATYNVDRILHNTTASFSFLPVYLTASLYPVGTIIGIAPYAKVDVGYNVSFTGNAQYLAPVPFVTTLTGGIYWGLGAGVKFANTIFADIMFTSYSGTYNVALASLSTEVAILYTKVSLNVGIGFDL